MLVSQSNNFVFVHIQKTGGVSISEILKAETPDATSLRPRHMIASQGTEMLDDWDERFKFAFVRNPWSRLVSWYSMTLNVRRALDSGHPLKQAQRRRLKNNAFLRYMLETSSNFEEFVKYCTDEVEMQEGFFYSASYNQLDYITDAHGELLVDFVGSFENFTADLTTVLEKVGISAGSIPHRNPSVHRHYSSYYTEETENIVRERFQRDIDYFGYDFERVESPA